MIYASFNFKNISAHTLKTWCYLPHPQVQLDNGSGEQTGVGGDLGAIPIPEVQCFQWAEHCVAVYIKGTARGCVGHGGWWLS